MKPQGTVSARGLYAIIYTTSVSCLYFALGVVAHRALGLTPVVFLAGGLFFALSAMTYAEGSLLHQERGGSTVFSRYAFNELVSFVSGWAIVLDYIILIAVTALAATNYLSGYWGALGHGAPEIVVAVGIIAFVAVRNVFGLSHLRLERRIVTASLDLGLQALIVVLGAFLVLHPAGVLDSVHLGSAPRWPDLLFALTVATVAFTGLEAAASLSGEVVASGSDMRRLVGPGTAAIVAVYVGISFIGISALPVHGNSTALGGRFQEAPLVGIVQAFHPHLLARLLQYVVAGAAFAALVAAANSAMLGISRLAYSLATNRQIPGALGRLEPRRGTPYVLILASGAIACALVLPTDLEFLVGIYAFGAMLAFTIAHLSVIVLRFREPEAQRPYRVRPSLRVRGVEVPIPSAVGALVAAVGWVSVVAFHAGARYVGFGWMIGGVALYVAYRRSEDKPLLRRVTVPERALREEPPESEFGSILVPLFGTPLDDDIVQTAGRLAGEDRDEQAGHAVIEALWVFEIPMALPLDARLPDAQLARARQALARAKAVGEEYEGVEVATATVRARRAGQAIVDEARRRGVEAIVLAAEEPSRIRGGALLGGAGGPLENYVGEVTKYVIRRAPCRVILTAPPGELPAASPRRPSASPVPPARGSGPPR